MPPMKMVWNGMMRKSGLNLGDLIARKKTQKKFVMNITHNAVGALSQ